MLMNSFLSKIRCGLLLQMSHVAWSVCVRWAHRWAVQKRLNWLRCIRGRLVWGKPHVTWLIQIPPREGTVLRGKCRHILTKTHECIARCSLDAADKCAAQQTNALAAAGGDKVAMRQFAKLLWTHVKYIKYNFADRN